MSSARYAIFFVPPADSALYAFGAAALGYDSYSGRDVPTPPTGEVDPDEWRRLTAEPRTYGFHATLKAPFRLDGAFSERDLIAAIDAFATDGPYGGRFAATIRLVDGFAAVVPSAAAPFLEPLAARCVRDFDRFRSPLTERERQRRLAQSLTPRQMNHLGRWGYPYVFEDFRFHMTLTGRLLADRVAPALRFLHDLLKRRPVLSEIVVDSVALLRQDPRFRVVRTVPLKVPAVPSAPTASLTPESATAAG